MELNEAIHRIILRHLKLLLACLAAGMSLGFLAGSSSTPLYSASARIVLEAPAPKSGAESASLADSARAIATSHSHVSAALKAVKIDRNPAVVAASRISVTSVGASDVLQLKVYDPDPWVASALANELADDIIRTRRGLADGEIPAAVAKLDTRIADLSAELSAVDRQIDAANTAIAGSRDPQTLAAATAAANAERSRRETVSQQLLTVQSDRSRLISTDAERPRAAVVDAAKKPVGRDASPIPGDVALGGLAGLTLGLGLASLLEGVRPSVVGKRSLSLTLNAPVLGELSCCPAHIGEREVRAVQTTLRLAANAVGVNTAHLVAVKAGDDLRPLGTLLQATAWQDREPEILALGPGDGWEPLPAPELRIVSTPVRPSHPFAPIVVSAESEPARSGASSDPITAPISRPIPMPPLGAPRDQVNSGPRHDYPGSERSTFRVMAFDPTSAATALEGEDNGFVVVVPEVGRRSDLESIADLIAVSRRPLLGIITYRRRRDCPARHQKNHHALQRVEPGGGYDR